MKVKETAGQKVFNWFNIAFMLLVGVIMLYPMWYVVCASLSSSDRLMGHTGVLLMPLGFYLSSYKSVFQNPLIITGYMNTLIIVSAGVCLNILLTSIGAYCLSQKNVYWQNVAMKLIIITMFFSGGLIPFYLLVSRTLGLNNSLLALILPTAINTYYLIIMRTSFSQIPDSLIESAKLDGATHFQILTKIVIPLSKSILAVMILYYAVGHWNSWFHASIFLKERSKYPLQIILREILIQNDVSNMSYDVSAADAYQVAESIKYAVIIVATAPILIVYPFLQRYFTKGVMIGAVKG